MFALQQLVLALCCKSKNFNVKFSYWLLSIILNLFSSLNLLLFNTAALSFINLLETIFRELQDETGRLRKSLAEREYEIRRLNKKILKCENEKRMLSGLMKAGSLPTS